VKGASAQFVIVGRIHQIVSRSDNGEQLYDITLQGPVGGIMQNVITLSNKSQILVQNINAETQEKTEIGFADLKRGDAIEVNYFIDIKEDPAGQVTNIIRYE
jgi:hypothetical protein